MKRSRFSEEKIIGTLREQEAGNRWTTSMGAGQLPIFVEATPTNRISGSLQAAESPETTRKRRIRRL